MHIGKIEGPSCGASSEGIPFWYYFFFPFLAGTRMALFLASVFKFLLGLYFGENNQLENFYYWSNSFDSVIISFSWELLTWLKFLFWLGSYYVIEVLTMLLAANYAIFIAFYGNPITKCNKEKFCSRRCFRRGGKMPLQAYHRDLMVLSCLVIREN